ncbi:MAG TPA: NUDIX hydrolase [Firmicutes bacterium]|nr:NUDIX hydrolase [Bacillota bacterium]
MQRRYPEQPVVGVGALILREKSVLLVRRGKEPAYGLWSLPGGAVELGETLTAAVQREIAEECGLDIEVGPPVAVLDSLTTDPNGRIVYHYVLVDFWAEVKGGALCSASDARAARWVPLSEVAGLALTSGLLPLLQHVGLLGTGKAAPGVFYWTQRTSLVQS